jgi:lipopolysaccharide biosynthesis glycosyltransferase
MDLKIASASRPAQHDKAVYFCADARFLPYAMFLINQIATATPDRDFDLVLLASTKLPEHPLMDLHQVRVVHLDFDALEISLFTDERISLASYLRIFGPELFKQDYRRLLYLDADMFYQRGSLSRLLEIDMHGKAVGACLDLPQMRRPKRVTKDFENMGLPWTKYFNAGMLLIDVPTWTRDRVTERALDVAAQMGKKLTSHDQSALNVVLRDAWLELNPVWNFIYSHQTAYFSAMFDVCIYHFVGRRKPFMGSYGGFPRRFTEPYRRFLTSHFPEAAAAVQDGMKLSLKWHLHAFVLALHAGSVRRYMMTEDQWLSDWDTR